jgi:DNA-binding CsgD family transcriptional regulator
MCVFEYMSVNCILPQVRLFVKACQRLFVSGAVPLLKAQLYLSVHTVRSHVRHIYAELDIHARVEAVARAGELGLL